MTSTDKMGEGLVRKPTGFMTNAEFLENRLSLKCCGGHRHVTLTDGRAKAAQVYPPRLCHEILRGLKEQLTADGVITDAHAKNNLMAVNSCNNVEAYFETFVDDLSGKNWTKNWSKKHGLKKCGLSQNMMLSLLSRSLRRTQSQEKDPSVHGGSM